MISSREFLQAAGVSLSAPTGIPEDVRHILITAALKCLTGPTVARILTTSGRTVSSRTVAIWLQTTRAWLRLPPANRGKRSRKYRRELEEWHRINGHPTVDEIDAGWIPLHYRSGNAEELKPATGIPREDCNPAANTQALPAPTPPQLAESNRSIKNQHPDNTPESDKPNWAEEARKTEEFAKNPHPTPQIEMSPLPPFRKPPAPGNVLTATLEEKTRYATSLQAAVNAYNAEARQLGYEISDTWRGHGDPLPYARKFGGDSDSHETTSKRG